MSTTPSTPASVMCEVMKVTRSGWLTRMQLANAIQLGHAATARWVAEMTAHGLLREREAARDGKKGYQPKVYSLSTEWGGQA